MKHSILKFNIFYLKCVRNASNENEKRNSEGVIVAFHNLINSVLFLSLVEVRKKQQ